MVKEGCVGKYKEEIAFYVSCLVLLIIGIFYDKAIVGFFAGNKNGFLTAIMTAISFLGKWYVVLLVVCLASFLFNKKKLVPFGLAILISGAVTGILKIVIERARPEMIANAISYDSFPSGHATAVFALFPLLKGKIKSYWLAFAILVAFSRIYLGMHYLTDVIAGIIIGYSTGIIIKKYWKK